MAQEFLTKHVVKTTFTWNGTDTGGVANSAFATGGGQVNVTSAGVHGTGVFIPVGAIVTNAYFNVTAAFTSGGAATMGLGIATGAVDLVAAIVISGAPWSTTGLKGTLAGNYAEATVAGDTAILAAARTAGSYITYTATKELAVIVGIATLTAGSADIYVEYVV